MRTINSIKNMITGIGGQLLTIILQFVSRSVFIYILGIEYLGISGLFINVLQVLNMAELGIGSAIVYSLYKPLASNDQNKIASILNFLKRAYFLIGCIIAVAGLLLLPFLPYIIKGITIKINVNLIFVLYLSQTVSSYWFFAYKGLLLQADQKNYIVNLIRYAISTFTVILQILFLVLIKSFILYLIIGIISNIAINIIISRKVDKLYPFINQKNVDRLTKIEKKDIFKNFFGVAMYKVNSTIVRSTDNIVISSFISTVSVGLYSNYNLIVSTLITMAKIIFSSVTASIGNLFVSETKDKSFFIFNCLNFLGFWLYSFITISLWVLLNPFISLWLGEKFLLGNIIVLIIVFDFLMDGFQQVVISYRDARGLFWQGRYRPVATAIINIGLSVILAPRIGIAGVLLGTIISRFLTTWWYEPWMVHKYAFSCSSQKYFARYIGFFALVIATALLTQLASLPFSEYTVMNFIVKLILCLLIPNTVFFLLFRKKEEFIYIINSLKSILRNTKKLVKN